MVSVSKVPCKKCGALILESTATKNGGLCVPCKSGKRESIEASKKWHKEQRELDRTDPLRKLWSELVHRAHETDKGFAGFTEAEKQYFAVGLLDGEVYNGGFDQYFFNSSGSYYQYALAGLKAIDATQSLIILEKAKQVLFDFEQIPEDTEKRRAFLRARASASRSNRLEELDKEFWKDPDGLATRWQEFAKRWGLV